MSFMPSDNGRAGNCDTVQAWSYSVSYVTNTSDFTDLSDRVTQTHCYNSEATHLVCATPPSTLDVPTGLIQCCGYTQTDTQARRQTNRLLTDGQTDMNCR